MKKIELIKAINSMFTGLDIENGVNHGEYLTKVFNKERKEDSISSEEYYFKVSKRQTKKKRKLWKLYIDMKYNGSVYIPF